MEKYARNLEESDLISVLMSVYNTEEDYLREAIDSVLKQTYHNFEFIIINDKSDKKTTNILRDYAKRDVRIELVENVENIGLTKSLNVGLRMAKGRYLARIDSDDSCMPERLSKQRDFMRKYPHITVVGTATHNQNGKPIKTAYMPVEWRKIQLLTSNCGPVHSSAFIDLQFLRNHRIYYDETKRYAQDYKLWTDIVAEGGAITIMPEDLVMHRIHNAAISTKHGLDQKKISVLISAEQLARMVDIYTENDFYDIMIKMLTLESNKEEISVLFWDMLNDVEKYNYEKLGACSKTIFHCELLYIYKKYAGKEKERQFDIGYWIYRIKRAIYKTGLIKKYI